MLFPHPLRRADAFIADAVQALQRPDQGFATAAHLLDDDRAIEIVVRSDVGEILVDPAQVRAQLGRSHAPLQISNISFISRGFSRESGRMKTALKLSLRLECSDTTRLNPL